MGRRKDGLLQRQVTVNGKRKVFYAHSERELIRKIREYEAKAERGATFSEAAERWLSEHEKEIASTTARRYAVMTRRAVEYFGDAHVADIRPKDVAAYVNEVAADGFARQTVSIHKAVVGMIFNKAVLDGDIPYNPCASVKLPKGLPRSRREIPTEEELRRIREGAALPGGLFANLLLYTGLRCGEAVVLTYGDIDRAERVIHVNKSVRYDASGKGETVRPKTEAGFRDVVLLDALDALLPRDRDGEDLLFPSKKGGLQTREQVYAGWEKFKKAAGVDVTPHQLRHAYATLLYEAGIQDKDAQELMGHSKITTTRDIYTHIGKSRMSRTAEKLNAAVEAKREGGK